MQWLDLKDWLSAATGLDNDALHIYAALFIQLGIAFVFRLSLAHPVPWLAVLAALLVNEYMDIYLPGGPIEQWQIDGGIQDLWNTMLLPTLLLMVARGAPWLLVGRARITREGDKTE